MAKQSRIRTRMGRLSSACVAAMLAVLLAAASGCEVDSFMDQSNVGRWERTPLIMPILHSIDVIERPEEVAQDYDEVTPADLIPQPEEYVIGSGDLLTITVFELLAQGAEWVQTRRVDDLGMIRVPYLGDIPVEGLTAPQLENKIAQIVESKGIVKDPIVTVLVQETRTNTYSVIGEGGGTNLTTGVGTYVIQKNDFRLLDALALSRGIPSTTQKIFIIRGAKFPTAPPPTPADMGQDGPLQPGTPANDPAEMIDRLLEGIDEPSPTGPANRPAAPGALDTGLDDPATQPPAWVYLDGKWVRAASVPQADPDQLPDLGHRVIEVPYNLLLQGDLRYNLIIRPGDIIRVPSASASGRVYMGGAIGRPGTFDLPGDRELTVKQLIFAAGGLGPGAFPERCDLTRRIGKDLEATVRINLRQIFEGTAPDFYLKPNDTLNVGTSFMSYLFNIARNGLRLSYGIGFVYDRNFAEDLDDDDDDDDDN